MLRNATKSASWLEACGAWRLFAILSSSIGLVFFVLWMATLYVEAMIEHRQRTQASFQATQRAQIMLAENLRAMVADLRLIAQGQALARLFQGEDGTDSMALAHATAIKDFSVAVAELGHVAQLRFIDTGGDEVIRVDRRGDDVVVVPQEQLQNKSARYYFLQSIDLPADGLYISPIDLNIEHERIELPWNPMLRLAMPVSAHGGSVQGVVVMNVFASDLLDRLQALQAVQGIPLQVLDQDGYWLTGVPEYQRWGFMGDHSQTLARKAPGLWERVRAARAGDVASAGSRYVFHALLPAELLAQDQRLSTVAPADQGWWLLAVIPPVSWRDVLGRISLPLGLLGLLATLAVSWGWSRAVMARRRAEQQRQQAANELVRTARLASLGGLVAGVAHELNTPLGNAVTVASTLGNATGELEQGLADGQLRRSMLEGVLGRWREGLAILQGDLTRASLLLGNFKQVAVDQSSEHRREFPLGSLLHAVASTMAPQFGRGPVVLEVADAPAIQLEGYPGALEQVLMILVDNARLHAFDAQQSGTVRLFASRLASGKVEIVVQDDGKGVPPDVSERIFEPFFTTRLGQGGSGLGLSIAFNIVTRLLGGSLELRQPPQGGTAMVLCLPVRAPDAQVHDTRSVYDVRPEVFH